MKHAERIIPLMFLVGMLRFCDRAVAVPLSTAFTYQGQLKEGGAPVNDTIDVSFTLWDAAGSGTPPTGGGQQGGIVTITGVPVVNGLFTVQVDFGGSLFHSEARWLQVAVRRPTGVGTFTIMSPRQPVTPTPYAHFSRNADTLDGQDSAAFLRDVPNPLDLSNDQSSDFVIRGTNTSSGTNSSGVSGLASAAAGFTIGTRGDAASTNGIGVAGYATATTGINFGVEGLSRSTSGTGVLAIATALSGDTKGVYGRVESPSGTAVWGLHAALTGTTPGVLGETDSGSGSAIGVLGRINDTTPGTMSAAVRGMNLGTGAFGIGVYGSQAGSGWGVYGTSAGGLGVHGVSTSGTGVSGGSVSGTAVFGETSTASGVTYGVWGETNSSSGIGVYGKATAAGGTGVKAEGNAAGGTALQIVNGGIRVPGAGVNTNTCAFIHQVTNANQFNCVLGITCGSTAIDNPYCNGDPNAVLQVTRRSNAPAFVVDYDVDRGQWVLHLGNEIPIGTYMNVGNQFNVLVIKP